LLKVESLARGVRMGRADWNKTVIKMVWKQFVVIKVHEFTR